MVAIKVETYQKPVLFASCYRPPKSTNNELLFEEIKRLTSMQRKNSIWIDRDFKLPDIDWEVKSISNQQYLKQLNERFIDLIDGCSMGQAVNFPTGKQNTLDLLITNRPSFINKYIPVPDFGDHDSTILSDLICHPQATKLIKRKIHKWERANLEELRRNVKEQMVKFVRTNTIIPQSIIYGSNLVQQLSKCKKNLFEAECHHLITVDLGLIENAKNMSEGKSIVIKKQEEQT